MAIKINGFGGGAVWLFRKHCSSLTSKVALSVAERFRRKKIRSYIDSFLSQREIPLFKFFMVETINRCNGRCSFCPANIRDEKRILKRMEEPLFDEIIKQLKEAGWRGSFFLQVNNEPLIDSSILERAKKVRNEMPNVKVCMITNGTLLNCDKLDQMGECIDQIVINDYSDKYRLSDSVKEIYKYVKKNPQKFLKVEIVINRRYDREILTTRAGNAPNKKEKNNKILSPCIYPFTDFIVFPDGKVGCCCNDCFEVTEMGDLNRQSIVEIWRGEKFRSFREAVGKGRQYYPFCKECDVVDAGSREKAIEE